MHVHRALVRAHDAVHHGQPQTSALTNWFGGEEGLKNTLDRWGVHAAAGITHRQLHMLAAGNAPARVRGGVGVQVMGQLNADGATLAAQRLDRIGAQVEQGLFNLGGVGQHGGRVRCDIDHHLNRWRQCHLEQAHGFMHHVGQLQCHPGGRFVAAESQDLAHQVTGPSSGLVNFCQADLSQRVWPGVLLGKRGVTQNGANDVVEVMCDAACHGAHSLHLVRFPQLRFQGVAVRLDLLAGAEIARKHRGGIAVWLALK